MIEYTKETLKTEINNQQNLITITRKHASNVKNSEIISEIINFDQNIDNFKRESLNINNKEITGAEIIEFLNKYGNKID